MKLSIGVPVHNAVDCTLRTLDKLIWACKQNGWDIELHVIDDNSSNETHERLVERLRLIEDFPWELVTTQSFTDSPAPNLAFNVNWLLSNVSADADYYLNLETDVFVNPKVLEIMVQRIRDTPDVCMVFPKQVTLNREYADFHFCQRGYIPVGEMPDDLTVDRYFNWTHFGCILVRGEDARNPGIRVDERFKLFCADQDYSLRLRQVTKQHILYTPAGHVIHVGHASSMEGSKPNPDPDCFDRINGKWHNFMVQAGL